MGFILGRRILQILSGDRRFVFTKLPSSSKKIVYVGLDVDDTAFYGSMDAQKA